MAYFRLYELILTSNWASVVCCQALLPSKKCSADTDIAEYGTLFIPQTCLHFLILYVYLFKK